MHQSNVITGDRNRANTGTITTIKEAPKWISIENNTECTLLVTRFDEEKKEIETDIVPPNETQKFILMKTVKSLSLLFKTEKIPSRVEQNTNVSTRGEFTKFKVNLFFVLKT